MTAAASTLTEDEYRRFRRWAAARIAESIVVDPPGDELRRAIPGFVREWTNEHYESELGEYPPEAIEEAVPTDPDAVESSATTPMAEEGGDEDQRRDLYAQRAVRADLVVALREHAELIERAIAVHDALERLVGRRDSRTDRRPSEVVEAFADWVAGERGEESVERARDAFTPLHVMRIDVIEVVDPDGEPPEVGLLEGLEAWLREAEPDAFHSPVAPDG